MVPKAFTPHAFWLMQLQTFQMKLVGQISSMVNLRELKHDSKLCYASYN
jgi:hypothetical protein